MLVKILIIEKVYKYNASERENTIFVFTNICKKVEVKIWLTML